MTRSTYPLGDQQARVLEIIRGRGAVTASEIAAALDLELTRAYTLLYSLEDRRLIQANRIPRPARWAISS